MIDSHLTILTCAPDRVVFHPVTWGAARCLGSRDLQRAVRGRAQRARDRRNVPENKHLRIGMHWKVFEGAVYEYEPTGEHDYSEP